MVSVVRRTGSVTELHGLDPFDGADADEARVWWCDFDDDALVLGSRQQPDLLDRAACRRAGLSIARRRSGGGAVLLRRDSVVWIDMLLPHGVAPDDVRGSMVWVGECWREAIEAEAIAAPSASFRSTLTVHRGGMVCTPWSSLVCFAGVGPGEVLRDGHKLVGLSQRRTRRGLRVQGLVHRRPVMTEMPPLFAGAVPDAALGEPETLDDVNPEVLGARLADLVRTRLATG